MSDYNYIETRNNRLFDILNKNLPLKINGWNKKPLILVFHQNYEHSRKAYNALKSPLEDFKAQDMRLILKDDTWIEFRNYNQDIHCVEGINPDLVICDQKPSEELLSILTFRCSGPEGNIIILV